MSYFCYSYLTQYLPCDVYRLHQAGKEELLCMWYSHIMKALLFVVCVT